MPKHIQQFGLICGILGVLLMAGTIPAVRYGGINPHQLLVMDVLAFYFIGQGLLTGIIAFIIEKTGRRW